MICLISLIITEEIEKMKNELNQLAAEKKTALANAEERERLEGPRHAERWRQDLGIGPV